MYFQQFKLSLLVAACFVFTTACEKDETPFVENKVPVANAGASTTITLPTDVVSVTGTGADSDGQVVAYLWSKVSGPASANIENPGSAATAIRGLQQGTYVFQLMVTDNKGATGVDTMQVQVNPAPIQTLTLQPTNNPHEWALILSGGNDQSSTNRPDIPVETWTVNGAPVTIRGLIRFDLSSIPATATIQSATLSLYSYPSPTLNGNLTDANFGSNNTMLVQQVTSNWSPTTISWATQPSATTVNQVVVPHTTQSVLDLNLDVTSQVASMVNNSANYGFLMKLQTETAYNSRIFVTSYNTTHPTKKPKLVVTYKL